MMSASAMQGGHKNAKNDIAILCGLYRHSPVGTTANYERRLAVHTNYFADTFHKAWQTQLACTNCSVGDCDASALTLRQPCNDLRCNGITRHRASTSMCSLTFRVRVTKSYNTPAVWTKWNGARSKRVDVIADEGSLRRHA